MIVDRPIGAVGASVRGRRDGPSGEHANDERNHRHRESDRESGPHDVDLSSMTEIRAWIASSADFRAVFPDPRPCFSDSR